MPRNLAPIEENKQGDLNDSDLVYGQNNQVFGLGMGGKESNMMGSYGTLGDNTLVTGGIGMRGVQGPAPGKFFMEQSNMGKQASRINATAAADELTAGDRSFADQINQINTQF